MKLSLISQYFERASVHNEVKVLGNQNHRILAPVGELPSQIKFSVYTLSIYAQHMAATCEEYARHLPDKAHD